MATKESKDLSRVIVRQENYNQDGHMEECVVTHLSKSVIQHHCAMESVELIGAVDLFRDCHSQVLSTGGTRQWEVEPSSIGTDPAMDKAMDALALKLSFINVVHEALDTMHAAALTLNHVVHVMAKVHSCGAEEPTGVRYPGVQGSADAKAEHQKFLLSLVRCWKDSVLKRYPDSGLTAAFEALMLLICSNVAESVLPTTRITFAPPSDSTNA